MTKLGIPFEGMSWHETARARTAVTRTLARVLNGDATDRTSCETGLEFASLLSTFGHEDVALRFTAAVMRADDADVADRAAQELLRILPDEGRAQGERASGITRGVDIAVMSIAELRSAVETGKVSPGETTVVAATSDPEERGFGEGGFRSALLLRYDDVSNPTAKGALSEAQSDEIANLVLDAVRKDDRPTPSLIACCCDEGVSRSAGVARAIALFLKGDGDAYRSARETRPNEHIASSVFRALERSTESGQSPLRRKIARRLQEFESARRANGKDAGSQDFRLALERDLLSEDDKARCLRRVDAGPALGRLLPDGALVEGALYRVHGPAARRLVRWLGIQVARLGGCVATVGSGAGARPVGKGYLAGFDARSLCTNGPDGAALLRTQLFALEEERGRVDVSVVEGYSTAREAWLSRYPKDVREGDQSDAFETSLLRCLPGAVVVLDDRGKPSGSSVDGLLGAAAWPFSLRAYEDLEVVDGEADEEVVVKRTFPRAHTHSTVDAGERQVAIAIDI